MYHLRNTNNQKWPLRTTLDRVEAWLKNEVDTYEAMMEHGADFSQEKIQVWLRNEKYLNKEMISTMGNFT